jgi:protein involved in polysaccharide export with SLBB domain
VLTHFFYQKNDVVFRGHSFYLLEGNFVKFIKLFIALFILSVSTNTFSQGAVPTDQQLEQFKKLPKSQQKVLAKKYGIDLNSINSTVQDSSEMSNEPSVFPRSLNSLEDIDISSEEYKFKPQQEEIERFGYELFAGEPTSFSPSENALVPESYIVGPGDTFTVNLYGKESFNGEVTIDREGRISVNTLEPVNVAGLQYKEVVSLLKDKVEKEMIGVRAFISMGKTRVIRVMVLGESYKPGAYTLPSLSSITHALFASGGISDIGSLRNIQLKRAGKTINTLDLYDLLLRGDSKNDVILKPGDVVFIPPVGKQVTIKGEVRRPAIFELKNDESIDDIIKMAGGLNGNAYPKKTVVERFSNDNSKTVVKLDAKDESINYQAANGDVIIIPSNSEQLGHAVTLIGAVTYPGNYAWSEGDRVSDLFTSLTNDFLPIADYEYALILREKNVKKDIEVHQFSPAEAVNNIDNQNLLLKPRDKVIIFSRYQSKQKEEEVISNIGLNEAQLELSNKIKLWNKYEEKQFYKFIDRESELDDEVSESDVQNISLNELLEKEKELKEDEYAVFSRAKLLKPILTKLTSQASRLGEVQIFAINGEVKYEGIYPKPINSTIKKAIIASGGLKESAYLENAEVTRFSTTGSSELEHLNLNLEVALNSPNQEQFELKSKDSLNIYPIPNWQKDLKVNLYGEVRFPGVYTIRKGESLSEVIKRAGGFTEFSYPEGAIFTRQGLKNQQQQQLNKLSEDLRRDIAAKSFNSSVTDASLSYSDMKSLIDDLAKVKAVGRLVINLPSIIEGKRDIPLENNDSLYIPSKKNSITVMGEINFSSSHLYDSTLTVDDYIARSGGLKQRADDERIYIVKASGLVKVPDGRSWFGTSKDEMLEPGDTIVVPLNTEHVDNLTLWSTATQILYQMGVAVAAISSL